MKNDDRWQADQRLKFPPTVLRLTVYIQRFYYGLAHHVYLKTNFAWEKNFGSKEGKREIFKRIRVLSGE